ncbi:hypothetical protein I7I48_04067 [Histoplasma ohiense]|nr:hypothetical protein I7I48_04067 [Histoplasma ohiense (nom. inval.)]
MESSEFSVESEIAEISSGNSLCVSNFLKSSCSISLLTQNTYVLPGAAWEDKIKHASQPYVLRMLLGALTSHFLAGHTLLIVTRYYLPGGRNRRENKKHHLFQTGTF